MRRRLFYALSIAAATVPIAFALIRAVRTGSDFRYFWVALASLLGSVATVAITMKYLRRPTAFPTASAIFVVATLFAIATAVTIGTTLNIGLLVVAAAFGFWFAVAGFAYRLGEP